MEHNNIIIISSGGSVGQESQLSLLYNEIKNWQVSASYLYMNEADYEDIVKWSNQ